jgi:D-sedoheptulose 7-phosphate isomerase
MARFHFVQKYEEEVIECIENPLCLGRLGPPISREEWLLKVAELVNDTIDNKRAVYFIGNGASASMASHFSADFSKCLGVTGMTIHDSSLLTCFSNDYSFEDSFREMLKIYFKKGDCLVAISSSGESANVVNAADYVSSCGLGGLITFTGFDPGNRLCKLGDVNMHVDSKRYGIVEVAHAFHLHCLLDFLCESRGVIR